MPRRVFFLIPLLLIGCARTEIIESPKTAFVADVGEPQEPMIVWTSRTLPQYYEYLGIVKVRSWTYDGALARLTEGGKSLRADALVDVHYEPIGFLSSMQAFAVKFK